MTMISRIWWPAKISRTRSSNLGVLWNVSSGVRQREGHQSVYFWPV